MIREGARIGDLSTTGFIFHCPLFWRGGLHMQLKDINTPYSLQIFLSFYLS